MAFGRRVFDGFRHAVTSLISKFCDTALEKNTLINHLQFIFKKTEYVEVGAQSELDVVMRAKDQTQNRRKS